MSIDRSKPLDLLRGICILAVLLWHIDIRIPFAERPLGALLPQWILSTVFHSGHYGVKVFFVLSGFLITGSLLSRWPERGRISLPTFYQMRFARIAPCLLMLLGVLCVLHLAAVPGFVIPPEKTTLPRALLAAGLFHLNWLECKVGYLPAAWDVLWSLSVEEGFYLFYPLLLRFSAGWMMVLLAMGLALVGPGYRTTWAASDIASDYAYLAGADCLAIGCAAAWARFRWPCAEKARGAVLAVGGALASLVVVFRFVSSWLRLGRTGLDVTVLAVGIAMMLYAFADREARTKSSPMTWLGRHSYEIYLTHSFAVVFGTQLYKVMQPPAATIPLWYAGIAAASAGLGYAMARWVSAPWQAKLRPVT